MANERITVDLIARTQKYTTGMKRAGQSTRGLVGEMKNSENAGIRMMGGLTKAAAGFGLAFAAGATVAVASSIKAFADFDSKLTSSLAIMGDVSEAMRGEMSDAAREIGLTTKFSAGEAAESYFFLASAGMDAAQSIAALPAVAEFAQAGNFDMALATDLATDALSSLGLASKDPAKNLRGLTRVTDVFVKANTLANTSVQQVSEAITNKLGGSLRSYGIELEEGVAVLAAYADQGLKGAAAGEAMNIMLRDLKGSAVDNAEAFAAVGIEVLNSEGNFNSMADIVGDLTDAFGTLSVAEQTKLSNDLGFQDRSFKNIQLLFGQEEAIRSYGESLLDAGGITKDVAEKQMVTLSEAFGLLGARVDDVKIGIGEELAPTITDMMPAMEGMIDAMGDLATTILPAVFDGIMLLGTGLLEIAGWWSTSANAAADYQDVLKAIRGGDFSTGDNVLDLKNAMAELERRAALTEDNFKGLIKTYGATGEEALAAAADIKTWIDAEWEGEVPTTELARWIRELEVALIDEAAAMLLSGEATRAEIETKYGMATASEAVEEARRLELAAHWEEVNAAREATAAGGDEADQMGDTTEEIEGLAGALAEATTNQTSLANAMREFADPTFKAVSSIGRLKTAQENLDTLIAEGKGGTDEYAEAMLAMADANLSAQAALDEFEGTGVEEQVMIIADALNIGDEQARSLLETLGLLDGKEVSMVIDVESRARITTGGSRVGDPEVNAAIANMDLLYRQHGGPLGAGQMALVGEQGPELFVPSRAGVVLPAGTFGAAGGGSNIEVTVNNPTTRNLDRDLQVGLLTAQTAGLVENF